LGNPWLEHNLSADLAELARLEGDRAAERARREECLALSRALATPRSVAAGQLALAALTLDEGDLDAARRYSDEGLRLMRDLGNLVEVPRALEGMAGLAAATGRPARALRLAGAAAAIRAAVGTRPLPVEQENLDRWLTAARQALGAAEQAAAWGAGRALTLEEAIAAGLAEVRDG
jgi:hypothetical protein